MTPYFFNLHSGIPFQSTSRWLLEIRIFRSKFFNLPPWLQQPRIPHFKDTEIRDQPC